MKEFILVQLSPELVNEYHAVQGDVTFRACCVVRNHKLELVINTAVLSPLQRGW